MAFTYTLRPSGLDSHQSTPYWFAAFVRFQERDTFTRRNLKSSENASKGGQPTNSVQLTQNGPPPDPLAEIPTLLMADADVVTWSVTSAKDQHVSNCQLTLANSETDYVAQLASGDWMGFWAFDDYADFVRVRAAVASRDQANGFRDGLKFIGRVDSVRKSKVRAPTGMLSIQYSITGVGFNEFDSIMYYNPILASKYESAVSLWMMELGQGVNNLIMGTNLGKGLIPSHDVIPKLTRICLGVGPSEASKGFQPDQVTDKFVNPAKLQSSQNRAYRVPQTVGRWLLGAKYIETEKAVGLTYADLLRMYIGIQKYGNSSARADNFSTSTDVFRSFLPEIKSAANNAYQMPLQLSGTFRCTVTPFDGKPFWSLLRTYINEPIDELFTCLRVDPAGKVMPSLIARQNPMSTKWFVQNSGYDATAFTELPRWEVDPALIVQLDVGRSNVTRFNYLHFQGQDMTGGNENGNMAVNYSRNPPIIDPDDISRSGLRMFSKILYANVFEGTNDNSPGGKWQRIMADILMGSHLKYSGTLVSKFIQEPIPEGDNLVVDGVIYHIERVIHSGSVSPFGMKEANTTLHLSNGIAIENDTDNSSEIIYPDLSSSREDDGAGTTGRD
jgi:hypothetical protein